MNKNWTLPANQTAATPPAQLQGRYFVVTAANGPFQIQFGNELPIDLQRNEAVMLPEGATVQQQNVRLLNQSGVENSVTIHCSNIPVQKKLSADIAETVSIADNQQVGIDPALNAVQVANAVQIAGGQSVGVSSLPAVQIDAGQSVAISGAVQIDHGAATLAPSVTTAANGSASASVAAGARYVRFESATDYTVDGQTIPGGQVIELPMLPKGETYDAVSYQAPAATDDLIITEVR